MSRTECQTPPVRFYSSAPAGKKISTPYSAEKPDGDTGSGTRFLMAGMLFK